MKVRLRFTKSFLRRTEYCLWLLGLAALVCAAIVWAQAKLFQAQENYSFENMLGQAPTPSIRLAPHRVVIGSAEQPVDSSNVGTTLQSTVIASAFSSSSERLVGRLEIPRLQLSVMVLEGVSARILRLAVGHIPGTALPGEPGNVGLAGHRDTFFRALRDIREKDVIVFTSVKGAYYYQVGSREIVKPSEMGVLKPSGQASLTLITCYPFFFVGPAPERFVVHARQIDGYSASKIRLGVPVLTERSHSG